MVSQFKIIINLTVLNQTGSRAVDSEQSQSKGLFFADARIGPLREDATAQAKLNIHCAKDNRSKAMEF
jgi:hypothetical protein